MCLCYSKETENQLGMVAYTYTWWPQQNGETVLGVFKSHLVYRVVNSKIVWDRARTSLKGEMGTGEWLDD